MPITSGACEEPDDPPAEPDDPPAAVDDEPQALTRHATAPSEAASHQERGAVARRASARATFRPGDRGRTVRDFRPDRRLIPIELLPLSPTT
jgi:hypothetical protein